MNCETWREVVSADLDGEATPAESAAVEEHLAECAACRRWAERAAVVTRRARTRPAEAAPDLVGIVLGRPASACGCAATCGCGCQEGRACRCAPLVA